LAGWPNVDVDVDVGWPKAEVVVGRWANADAVVVSDGLGGRCDGPEVGASGVGWPVAAAVAAMDAAKGLAVGADDVNGFAVAVAEGANADGPPPAADANPVNGLGAPNAEVADPKAPLAGWRGCPNALVVGCVDAPNGLLVECAKALVPDPKALPDAGGLAAAWAKLVGVDDAKALNPPPLAPVAVPPAGVALPKPDWPNTGAEVLLPNLG